MSNTHPNQRSNAFYTAASAGLIGASIYLLFTTSGIFPWAFAFLLFLLGLGVLWNLFFAPKILPVEDEVKLQEQIGKALANASDEAMDLEDALAKIGKTLRDQLNYEYAEVWDFNPEAPARMVYPHHHELKANEVPFFEESVLGKGIDGQVKELFTLDDLQLRILYHTQPGFPSLFKTHGWNSVMLISSQLDPETCFFFLLYTRQESWTPSLAYLDALGPLLQTLLSKQLSDDLLRRNQVLMGQAEQSARIGSFVWTRKDDILECSDSFTRLFQDIGASSIRTKADFMALIPAESKANVEAVFSFDVAPAGAQVFDFKIGMPEQTEIFCDLRVVPRYNRQGRAVGLMGIVRDITKYRQQSDKLQSAIDELERSNEDLEQFAYVASHDLQEPLRKIRAFGDRLMSKYKGTDAPGQDYVERMQNAAERMQRLITDLLTFSRVSRDTGPKEVIDLQEILDEVLNDLETAIQEKDARFDLEKLPSLQANPVQMRQLLQNLVGNALKFSHPDRNPEVKVTARKVVFHELAPSLRETLADQSYLELQVQDNGIGFDEKYVEQIFTVFQRLHGRSEYPGTGIGLAICKKIAENHFGTIFASSMPGKGATFTVYLPFTQSTSS